ncbi:uncharacterized protein TNCV_638841 [Trichonephila clavipes]|nr:uncharacterized protein TNCV_638841 [Trichonephila clavipes]
MGATIPNDLHPGAVIWFEETQVLLVKVQHVPGWRPMKQLAVCVHFLQCGGLLGNWSVKGVLSLVFGNCVLGGYTDYSQRNAKRRGCGECSEEVGEKGLLESRSPTFRIDSSEKYMRRTGF